MDTELTHPDLSCASKVRGREFCLTMEGEYHGVSIKWNGFKIYNSTNTAKHHNKVYVLNRTNYGYNWCGWQLNPSPSKGKWIRMSAWVKYIDVVPNPSINHGFKI